MTQSFIPKNVAKLIIELSLMWASSHCLALNLNDKRRGNNFEGIFRLNWFAKKKKKSESPFEIIPFIVILSFRSSSKQCELDLAISWNQETNDNMQAILSIALSTKQEKLWQATWLSYILQPLGTRRCYGGSSSLFLSSQVYRAVFFTRAPRRTGWHGFDTVHSLTLTGTVVCKELNYLTTYLS